MKITENPFADSRLARYLTLRLDQLAASKSRCEIAAEVGYDQPNIISMIERGDLKMPLDKVPAFANALQCDVGFLMQLAVEQHWDGEGSDDYVPRFFARKTRHDERTT